MKFRIVFMLNDCNGYDEWDGMDRDETNNNGSFTLAGICTGHGV
jgi:hypothetical protein